MEIGKDTHWRKVEVLRDGQWVPSDGWDIKPGDKYKFTTDDLVMGKLFVAESEPRSVEPSGNWAIVSREVTDANS